MLHKFAVKNFRNFADWLTFDMTSQQYAFNDNAVKNGIIEHGMIYGPNGGGKSNLGLAMVDPVLHLIDSSHNHPNLNLENNYLNGGVGVELAEFVFEFYFEGVKVEYRYGKLSLRELVYETLLIDDEEVIAIDRRESNHASISLQRAKHLKKDVGDSKISLLKYVHNNTLSEDSATDKTFDALFDFIEGMVFFRSLSSARAGEYVGKKLSEERLSERIINTDSLQDFESFLNNKAGVECTLDEVVKDNGDKSIYFDFGGRKLEFAAVASTGTLALGIFYFWWLRFQSQEVTFAYMDEFDAFYHHALASVIVEKVADSDCQTLMTTHNTGVMSNDLLRPDCYFILDKDIKPITALTNKELRKAHNLEKIYKGMSS